MSHVCLSVAVRPPSLVNGSAFFLLCLLQRWATFGLFLCLCLPSYWLVVLNNIFYLMLVSDVKIVMLESMLFCKMSIFNKYIYCKRVSHADNIFR